MFQTGVPLKLTEFPNGEGISGVRSVSIYIWGILVKLLTLKNIYNLWQNVVLNGFPFLYLHFTSAVLFLSDNEPHKTVKSFNTNLLAKKNALCSILQIHIPYSPTHYTASYIYPMY